VVQDTPQPPAAAGSTTRPALPAGVREYFLPNNLTFTQAFKASGQPYPEEAYSQGLLYRPVLLAQAQIRFLNRKYNLDAEIRRTAIVPTPDRRGVVRWENYTSSPIEPRVLDEAPDPQARFAPLEAPFSEAKILSALQKDFMDWVYRSGQATVRSNQALKLFAGPEVSPAEFRTLCAEAARAGRDTEAQKVEAAYDKKLAALEDKLAREERELSEDESELSQRKMEEMGTHAENIFGLFTGRRSSRRLSSSLSKRRMTAKAKADVEESQDVIKDLEKQLAALEKEKAQALEEVNARWGELANEVEEISVTPLKKDILLDLFGVAWMPYHLVKISSEIEELPGYGARE
jgi:hypothetical protein